MTDYRLKTIDMEISLAFYFDYPTKVVVPNIRGFFSHECDLVVLSEAGFATEVEIKISRADLIKDKQKNHSHEDNYNRIKYLYFAIPEYLEKDIEHIPDRAGILTVLPKTYKELYPSHITLSVDLGNTHLCSETRKPKTINNYKLSEAERYKIARIGTRRIWSLKRKVRKLNL